MSARAVPVVVPGWPRPRGYSNGVVTHGRLVHIAGQVAWDAAGRMVSPDFVAQFAQALRNVRAVLEAAGGRPEDLASMTVFVTDVDAYRRSTKELGAVWREVIGPTYPAMALVGVAALVEEGARLEIQATAALEGREEDAP